MPASTAAEGISAGQRLAQAGRFLALTRDRATGILSTMKRTPLSQLVEIKLGRSLEKYVIEARNDRETWRTIADGIAKETGIMVPHQTIRSWFDGVLVVTRR